MPHIHFPPIQLPARICPWLLALLLSTPALSSSVMAQSALPPKRAPLNQAPVSALELSLRQHYSLDTLYLAASSGVAIEGLFTLAGDLTPEIGALQRSPGVPVDPRALAQLFLVGEAELFALEQPAQDLRLARIINDEFGGVHLVYHRYVEGLPVDTMEIRLHFTNDLDLYAVDGNIVPLLASEQEAIAEQLALGLLSKDELGERVLLDLQTELARLPSEFFIRTITVVATRDFPHVFAKLDVIANSSNGRWLYTLDAVTGEIHEKLDTLDSALPWRSVPGTGAPPPTQQNASLAGPILGPDKEGTALPAGSTHGTPKTAELAPAEGFKLATPGPGDDSEAYNLSSEAATKRRDTEAEENDR